MRLALALHSAHRRGVLHLDVRPASILFDGQGAPLLAGHALGRVLQRAAPSAGAVFDPAYAARELFGWAGRLPVPPPTCTRWARRCTRCWRVDPRAPRLYAGAARPATRRRSRRAACRGCRAATCPGRCTRCWTG
ncbi:hypothetical protein IHE61_25495 [Streptomyces sp. GKU 257-1]|nr:hypothetical protein [Streptomyces sp. GKU 257-1]